MKADWVAFVFALLCVMLVGQSTSSVAAQAEGTIYIRSDGSVEPATTTIQRNGNTYLFTANIHGFIVVERDNIVIDGLGFSLQGTGSELGIRIENRTKVTIKNMKIQDFSTGIYCMGSSNIVVSGNCLTNNGLGMGTSPGFPQTYDETVSPTPSFNTVEGNYIASNRVGVFVGGALNSITGNHIIANSGKGIDLSGSKNSISENIISDNENGLYVSAVHAGIPSVGSQDNYIYRNNFVRNTKQVNDFHWEDAFSAVSVNRWDGNYWSDYNGTDADSDGIGDTPYIIDADNQDHYPLKVPISVQQVILPEANPPPPPDTTPPAILIISPENTTTYMQNDVSLTFTVNETVSSMGYRLEGQEFEEETIAGNTTLTSLSNGSYRLTVYAEDAAGNAGTSETIYFNVAKEQETEPFLNNTTILLAVSLMLVAVVIGVSLLFYFRKRNH